MNLASSQKLKYLKFHKIGEIPELDNTYKSNNVKRNRIKKSKISKKAFNNNLFIDNISSSKKTFLNNNITKNILNTKVNKKDYPYNMNENQIYEIFLKINNNSDSELNSLSYKSAIKIDKRTYLEYYLSLLRTKHLLFFSFWPKFDYNSKILKIFLFFFEFTLTFFVNALFFNDDTMHKIYEDKGSFDFIYNIPQILLSSLISGFIKGLIQFLSLTSSNLINMKKDIDNNNIEIKKHETLKKIKVKIVIFFLITLPLLIAFWLYLSCFCAVYKNTQIHLIKDTLISFLTSMITPFWIYILPGIFRLSALNNKKKDKELMFKFSNFLQII